MTLMFLTLLLYLPAPAPSLHLSHSSVSIENFIYMCGSVVVISSRKHIWPILNHTANHSVVNSGRCRWKLSAVGTDSSGVSLLGLEVGNRPSGNSGDDGGFISMGGVDFCVSYGSIQHEYDFRVNRCYDLVKGEDSLRLVQIQVVVDEEDMRSSRDEEWYLRLIVPFTRHLRISLYDVGSLKDLFGKEMISLGIGKGVELLETLELKFVGKVPRLDDVLSDALALREFLVEAEGETYGTFGRIYLRHSPKLVVFRVSGLLVSVEDISIASPLLKEFSVMFPNFGRFLLQKWDAVGVRNGTVGVLSGFEQVVTGAIDRTLLDGEQHALRSLNMLYLVFTSADDRRALSSLPGDFFRIESYEDCVEFRALFCSSISDRSLFSYSPFSAEGKKVLLEGDMLDAMQPWTAGVPKCLKGLYIDWFVATNAFMNEVRSSAAKIPSSEKAESQTFFLRLYNVAWLVNKVTGVWKDNHWRILLVPKLLCPACHGWDDGDVSDFSVVAESIGLELTCILCREWSHTPPAKVSLSRNCVSGGRSGGYTSLQLRDVILFKESQCSGLTLSVNHSLSIDKVGIAFPDNKLVLDIANADKIVLSDVDFAIDWSMLFPCSSVPSELLVECCSSVKPWSASFLSISHIQDFVGDTVMPSWFCHLPRSLTSLVLEGLSLRSVKESSFSRFPRLSLLSLAENQISSYPKRLLWNFDNDVTVLLSHNNITELPDGAFEHGSVQIANFSANQMYRLPSNLCDNSTIRHLYLASNELTGSFTVCNSLYTIDISHNHVRKLYVEGSKEGFLLVKASHNTVEEVTFKGVAAGILQIDLSFNRIKKLHKGLFSNMHNLQILNLSSNNIGNELSEGLLSNSCSSFGCVVDMSNNSIANSSLAFSSFFYNSSVKIFDLSHNGMSSFPYDLKRIPYLPPQDGKMDPVLFKSYHMSFILEGNVFSSIEESICMTGKNFGKSKVYYNINNCGVLWTEPSFLTCSDFEMSYGESKMVVTLENNPLKRFPQPFPGGKTNLLMLSLLDTNVNYVPCDLSTTNMLLRALNIGPRNEFSDIERWKGVPECCQLRSLLHTDPLVSLSINIAQRLELWFSESSDSSPEFHGVCSYRNGRGAPVVMTFRNFMNASVVDSHFICLHTDPCVRDFVVKNENVQVIFIIVIVGFFVGTYVLVALLVLMDKVVGKYVPFMSEYKADWEFMKTQQESQQYSNELWESSACEGSSSSYFEREDIERSSCTRGIERGEVGGSYLYVRGKRRDAELNAVVKPSYYDSLYVYEYEYVICKGGVRESNKVHGFRGPVSDGE